MPFNLIQSFKFNSMPVRFRMTQVYFYRMKEMILDRFCSWDAVVIFHWTASQASSSEFTSLLVLFM